MGILADATEENKRKGIVPGSQLLRFFVNDVPKEVKNTASIVNEIKNAPKSCKIEMEFNCPVNPLTDGPQEPRQSNSPGFSPGESVRTVPGYTGWQFRWQAGKDSKVA